MGRPPSVGRRDDLAPSQLKVKLLGTMVADPEEYSSALIAEESSPDLPSSYSIPRHDQDREVVSIENTQVGLKGPDGKIEYLLLEGGELTQTVAAGDGEPTAEGEGVDQIGDNKFSVSKDVFDKYINDLEGISRMGRALLHRGPDGEFDGYRLSAIRRNTLADQLGIKNGDIIHAVNGQPLNSSTVRDDLPTIRYEPTRASASRSLGGEARPSSATKCTEGAIRAPARNQLSLPDADPGAFSPGSLPGESRCPATPETQGTETCTTDCCRPPSVPPSPWPSSH